MQFADRHRWLVVVAWSLFACSIGHSTESVADDKGESAKPPKTMNGLPLIFSDDFSSGKADRWEPTDKTAWRVVEQEGRFVYNQFKRRSDYEPPVRSPYNRSLVKDLYVGSFVLDVQMQATVPEYGHRDLCVFFGFQDPAHLYYVHLGQKADDHANQVFIVNNEPRKKISTKSTDGTPWDDEWHHVRIVRDAKSGKVEVYFDDMETPIMEAVDKTFTWGRVGLGSFDDAGNFANVLIYGEKVDPPQE